LFKVLKNDFLQASFICLIKTTVDSGVDEDGDRSRKAKVARMATGGHFDAYVHEGTESNSWLPFFSTVEPHQDP
jgi:hypothetical protein